MKISHLLQLLDFIEFVFVAKSLDHCRMRSMNSTSNTPSANKGLLAKLLANENINLVVDGKLKTAAFDLKSRTMYLPNWQDVPVEVTDLLIGHEDGHALYTPEEGWHNAGSARGAKFKGFLNVCEDARIEKKIKRKYPGLRRSFLKGYKELFDRDFFGVQNTPLDSLLLIDRVNLHCKIGAHLSIPFSSEERALLQEVVDTETWEQVVAVAEKLFDYCKEEQEKKKNDPQQGDDDEPGADDSDEDQDGDDGQGFGDDSEDDSEDDSDDDSYVAEGDDSEDDSDDGSEEGEESDESSEGDDSGESDSDSDEKKESSKNNANSEKDESEDDGEEEFSEGDEPESLTDKAFRENEGSLANSGDNIRILEMPTYDTSKIISARTWMNAMFEGTTQLALRNRSFFTPGTDQHKVTQKFLADFNAKHKNSIDLYVKEFQMKKSAAAWKKARVSDTGDISASKLSYYKLTDQVFKARTIVPNGKNHGMVMLLDWSGSMAGNLVNSLEQVLVLASFCKRVAIPFRVLTFTSDPNGIGYAPGGIPVRQDGFSAENNQIFFSALRLVEIVSSDMSSAEFNKALAAMLMIGHWFAYNQKLMHAKTNRTVILDLSPSGYLRMGDTPLIGALAVMLKYIPAFKAANRLDVVTLVTVTDGDANTETKFIKNGIHDIRSNEYDEFGNRKKYNTKLKYGNSFHSYIAGDTRKVVGLFLNLLKEECDARTLGFFLTEGFKRNHDKHTIMESCREKDGQAMNVEKVRDELNDKNFVESYPHGFDRFFVVKVKALEVKVLAANASVSAISKHFNKSNGDRKLNRILATKFMEFAA